MYEHDALDAAEPAAVTETTGDTSRTTGETTGGSSHDTASHGKPGNYNKSPLTQGPQGDEGEQREPDAGVRAGEGEGEEEGAATGHFSAGGDDASGWQVSNTLATH